ncbi:hypothetical protein [Arthrobacter sp. B1805]|uniref:hypothetical protein n=1 Tax=Arthrobacter sp. B1805 TaxID=2058892 RepID=UPI000CE409C4|nr:hypothetical protein [Arthrobacter sp. B1805]
MHRSATSALFPSGALCLAVVLASCSFPGSGTAGGDPDQEADVVTATSSAPTPTSTQSPSPAPSPSPATPPASTASANPVADGDWATYTTTDGGLSFDHPSGWSVAVSPDAPAQGASVIVTDEAGRQLATLRTNLVTGAVCPAELPYALLDSEPLPALAQGPDAPRFVFEGRTDPAVADPVAASTLAYGITSAPEPAGPTACPISHFFTWPPSGAAFGGTYDPFEVYPGKPMHIDTPQTYMETEEYRDIRTMITSLRPAG